MTDAQFQTAQDKIDAMARATRRGTPVDRKVRDAALLAVAVKHGLVTL